MRGADRQTSAMFSYLSPEELVPATHPLRVIRPLVNAALERLSGEFDKIYSGFGRGVDHAGEAAARPAAPGVLLGPLGAAVDGADRLQHDVRWFVDLSMDAAVWDVTVFTKNRDRLLEGDIARAFLAAILVDPQVRPLLSDEHFSVDGTLIEAWASMKSFKPKDGSGGPPAPGRNAEVDFRGKPHGNQTHASTTEPDAQLYNTNCPNG